MEQKILKFEELWVAFAVLNLIVGIPLAFVGGFLDHSSSFILLISFIPASLLTLVSLYGLIKIKIQTYIFLSTLVLSYLPLVYVGGIYFDQIGFDSLLFVKLYQDMTGYDILYWSPFVVIPLLLIVGIFLNYHRTGNFFK